MPRAEVENGKVAEIGKILVDIDVPLRERFRALFTLRSCGGKEAIDAISSCFTDESALLKHELAYCLGQMQDEYAIPVLIGVLEDESQEPIVRHEAGEALAAIGPQAAVDILKKYEESSIVEIAETCQLGLRKMEWQASPSSKEEHLSQNPYNSVDPAPSSECQHIDTLQKILLDEQLPLFTRYRAMFSLRNIGTIEAIKALALGLKCQQSALFRHEIAYVLGQIQHPACTKELMENLRNLQEESMVRHECAEALGAIATVECFEVLSEHLADKERIVRESCEVALDMADYEISSDLQYANVLQKLCEKTNAHNLKE